MRRSFFRAALGAAVLVAFATLSNAQSRRDPQAYRLAIGMIQRGLHADAARQLQRFLQDDPDHPRASEAWYRLGTCEIEMHELEAATAAFERALLDRELGLRPECHYRLATTLQQLGRYEDAVAHFEAVPKEHGADHYLAAAAWYGAGECLRDAGRDEPALARFLAAAAAAGDDSEFAFSGLYQAGFVQLRLERLEAAEGTFGEVAERFPDHDAIGEILYLQGEAAYRRERLDNAEDAWLKAAAAGGPFVDDALHGLAWCAVKDGRTERARKLFRQLVDEHPDSELAPRAQLEVGRLLLRGGDNAEAERALQALLSLDQLDGELRRSAYELRGLARLELGEAESAAQDFELALGTAGAAATGARLHYNLGDSFASRDEWEDALASYEKASETEDPELLGDALYAQALALHKLGRFDASEQRARRLVSELPRHRLVALANFAIAENLFGAEKYAAAAEQYDALAPDHPMAAEAAFKGAWATYLAGDPKDGAARFETLAADQGQSAEHREEALSMLALCRYEASDLDGALAAADRYLARHGDGRFLARTERIAGRILKRQGELDAAARRLKRAAESETAGERAAELGLEQADVLFERGDYAAAREAYANLEDGPPATAARAFEGLAWCAFELGDDEECARNAERALSHAEVGDAAPGLTELLVNLYHRGERWGDAADAARRYLKSYPNEPRVPELRYALGLALARGGDDRAAVEVLAPLARDGGAERPDLVHYELAWALRRSGDEDAALAAFLVVAETSEDEDLAGEARLHLGEAAIARGDLAAAREHLQAATGRYRGRALYRAGHTLLTEERLDDAATSFEQVVALGGDDDLVIEASFMAGEVRLRAGDPSRAAEHLRYLLERAPDHARAQRARLYLGECAVLNDEPAEAVAVLETYLQRGAEEHPVAKPRANLWLGRARQARGEHEAAERAFATVTSLSSGELAAEAQFRLGECRRAREDVEAAAEAFVNLSILYTHEQWVVRGLFEAGSCYDELGQKDKARKFYGELVDRFPDSEEARQARNRIRGD